MASRKEIWKKRSVLTIGCLLILAGLAGQEKAPRSLFDLMSYREVLPVTIYADLDTVRSYRSKRGEVTAIMTFEDPNGKLLTWEMDIEMRGKFRRSYCFVPPLKFNFRKSQLKKANLANFDDMDVVTPCMWDSTLAKELILKEYLVYKMYNNLSPDSYRVQTIQMTFKNPQTGKEDKVWGFLIEDTAELSARIEAEKLDTMIISPEAFEPESFYKVYAFQSMIGNVDWGVRPVKNIKIFQRGETLIPVPYDFDFSAIVNAPYSRISINLIMRSDKQLDILNHTEQDPLMLEMYALLRNRQSAFVDLIDQEENLSCAIREKMMLHLRRYLEHPYRLSIPLPDKSWRIERPNN
jgi:hypothetical protein